MFHSPSYGEIRGFDPSSCRLQLHTRKIDVPAILQCQICFNSQRVITEMPRTSRRTVWEHGANTMGTHPWRGLRGLVGTPKFDASAKLGFSNHGFMARNCPQKKQWLEYCQNETWPESLKFSGLNSWSAPDMLLNAKLTQLCHLRCW